MRHERSPLAARPRPAALLAGVVGAVLSVVLSAGLAGCGWRADLPPPGAAPLEEGAPVVSTSAPPGAPVRLDAAEVLREWDRARGRAFAAGDDAALRALYADGSGAGRADLRLLRAYARRGLRVTGMRVQLLAVEVLHQSPTELRLRVTDRLTGAVAVAPDGTSTRLPEDSASTRVVELARSGEGSAWQVASVRE